MAGVTGQVVGGRYELLSLLGRGGMGMVWLAADRLIGRRVALKEIMLWPNGEDLAIQRERALREVRAAARIEHPSVVRVYDVFEEEGSPWIVMAYVEGGSLEARITDEVLPEREIAALGRDVLAGLTAAHAAEVLHRDVKPANILLGRNGGVFLVDFGIAQISGESRLTSRTSILGTPEFMAPERVNGLEASAASDLWSLGVTFFCALEGYSPFRRGSYPATLYAITGESAPRPRRSGPMADAIAGLLVKNPARRTTAAELDRRLRAILAGGNRTMPERPREPRRERVREPVREPVRSKPVRRPEHGPRLTPDELRAAAPVEGARLLLARPAAEAAALLAALEPRAAGPLADAMAVRPALAAAALAALSPVAVGRLLDHMTAEGACALLQAMTPARGAGILAHADERTVADILSTLGAAPAAVRLLEAMTVQRACRVLEYVPPPVIAALLAVSSDGRADRLCNGLSGPVRAEVRRLSAQAG
ncbi:protein kinase domain-containing protein [Microbispora sp. CA-102843]|uniref:protein kinase domain-containing protein n=1 Tax=Microbispora sp. CA-102843 TaxID=3239952 RepID=UPI003D93904F